MLMSKSKGLKIEYFNEDEDEQETDEFVINKVIEVEEVEVEVVENTTTPNDDLDDYIYQERVGVLELINYLPRIPKEVLNGERDFAHEEWVVTSSDFDKGFRPIESAYLEKYQVPDDTYLYRTQEDLSRNIVKLSPGMVAKWVKTTTGGKPLFPKNLLKDDFGFTQYAVAVYRNLMQYTCTRRFTCDWDEIDRDTNPPPIKNPELSEENPDYAMSSFYWESLEAQYQDYCDRMEWITEYKRSRSLREQKPEFIDISQEEAKYYQDISDSLKRFELAKQAVIEFTRRSLHDMNEQRVKMARQIAASGDAAVMEAYAETLGKHSEPLPLEEEADLWSENNTQQ